VLRHADTSVCLPRLHDLSPHLPQTVFPLLAAPYPLLIRLSHAYSQSSCEPNCRSNPIAHRVRRKRQRLPPSLLIENASDRLFPKREVSCPRRFRSRLATIREILFRDSLEARILVWLPRRATRCSRMDTLTPGLTIHWNSCLPYLNNVARCRDLRCWIIID
jgi:hypothetical protein